MAVAEVPLRGRVDVLGKINVRPKFSERRDPPTDAEEWSTNWLASTLIVDFGLLVCPYALLVDILT